MYEPIGDEPGPGRPLPLFNRTGGYTSFVPSMNSGAHPYTAMEDLPFPTPK
jgi:hypothetical protein